MKKLPEQRELILVDWKEDDNKDVTEMLSQDGVDLLDFMHETPFIDEKSDLWPKCEVNRKDQLEMVLGSLTKNLMVGEKCFAISNSWVVGWSNYVTFEMSPSPGAIDNAQISDINSPSALDKTKFDEIIMIHEDLWNLFVTWFGVKDGSVFERDVVEHNGFPVGDI